MSYYEEPSGGDYPDLVYVKYDPKEDKQVAVPDKEIKSKEERDLLYLCIPMSDYQFIKYKIYRDSEVEREAQDRGDMKPSELNKEKAGLERILEKMLMKKKEVIKEEAGGDAQMESNFFRQYSRQLCNFALLPSKLPFGDKCIELLRPHSNALAVQDTWVPINFDKSPEQEERIKKVLFGKKINEREWKEWKEKKINCRNSKS